MYMHYSVELIKFHCCLHEHQHGGGLMMILKHTRIGLMPSNLNIKVSLHHLCVKKDKNVLRNLK